MTRALLERCHQILKLPCDMDNGVREKIVNSTVEAIRAELARPESTGMTLMRACYEEQKKLAQQERKPMTADQVDEIVYQHMADINSPEGNPGRKLNAYRSLVQAGWQAATGLTAQQERKPSHDGWVKETP